MKRFVSILLVAALLMLSCFAEEVTGENNIPENQEVLAETEPEKKYIPVVEAPTARDYVNARELVRLLFVAAAGTDEETEIEARKYMTDEEQLKRNEDNACYRKTVLPWLMDVLTIENEKEVSRRTYLEHFVLEHTTEEGKSELLWENGEKVFECSDDMYALMWNELVDEALECLKENEFGKEFIEFVSSLTEEKMKDDLLKRMTRDYFYLWVDDINPEGLKETNEDFTFWLYSASNPGVALDYPVVKHTDNDYYMYRLFNRKGNAAGTLFMDFRNLTDLTDENTLVYGHNMKNGSMFGTLGKYDEQVYFESHPYMLVVAEDEIDLVEVYTAYSTNSVDVCYKISISELLQKLKYVKWVSAKKCRSMGLARLADYLESINENDRATACLKIGIEEIWEMLEELDETNLKAEFIEAFNDLKKPMEYVDDDVEKVEFDKAFSSLWELMEFEDTDIVKNDFYNGIDEFMELVNDETLADAGDFFYNGINDFLSLLKFVDRTSYESDFIYRIHDIKPYDRILTLSTCINDEIGKRYVVEGRLLNTWFEDEKWGEDCNDILVREAVSLQQ